MSKKKRIKKRLVEWLGPPLAYWAIRLLGWTMRFEVVNPHIQSTLVEKGIPFIAAFWHDRLLMMPLGYRGKRLSFLVSPHRDGQIIGRSLKKFGFQPIYGSSHKGGAKALWEMVRAIQSGSDVAIVPDGPRGPRHQLQVGVIELARRTGRPILPISFNASKKKVFKTWDRFLLPFPFSKGVFVWGEPIYVESKGDRDYLESMRRLVERRLNELTEEADRYFEKEPRIVP
ncbi:MAG: lysophospholipid acyltransferase family protein [Desulfobacterota bacterium]|nr:lysophospholipid acyltransferase family protein [Thermodesulfobacteriota bacterium]